MKKKILIITSIIVIIIILAISTTIIYKNQTQNKINNQTDNIVVNNNKLSEKKEYTGLEIQNTKIEKQDNQTNFTFTIKNNKQEKYSGGYARIECLDKKGNEIGNLIIYIPEIEKESSIEVNASTDMDIQEIYDYKIVSSEVN